MRSSAPRTCPVRRIEVFSGANRLGRVVVVEVEVDGLPVTERDGGDDEVESDERQEAADERSPGGVRDPRTASDPRLARSRGAVLDALTGNASGTSATASRRASTRAAGSLSRRGAARVRPPAARDGVDVEGRGGREDGGSRDHGARSGKMRETMTAAGIRNGIAAAWFWGRVSVREWKSAFTRESRCGRANRRRGGGGRRREEGEGETRGGGGGAFGGGPPFWNRVGGGGGEPGLEGFRGGVGGTLGLASFPRERARRRRRPRKFPRASGRDRTASQPLVSRERVPDAQARDGQPHQLPGGHHESGADCEGSEPIRVEKPDTEEEERDGERHGMNRPDRARRHPRVGEIREGEQTCGTLGREVTAAEPEDRQRTE